MRSRERPGVRPEDVMFRFTKYFSTKTTPPIGVPAASAPTGFTWQITDWDRLDRFLILGSEGGTYYVDEQPLTLDHAQVVARCLAGDGVRTVDRIVAIAASGRAGKPHPGIFALAMAVKLGDDVTRRAAYAALPQVCRIGTHLMHFASYAESLGGWGRGMRKAVGAWFNGKPATDVAYQLARYPARDGWSNRDLLRLAHPRAASPSHDRLFAWAVKGELPASASADPSLALIAAMEELKAVDNPWVAAKLIRDRRIPRECVPAPLLQVPEVWEALLEAMPLTALIHDLPTMTRVGLLARGTKVTQHVVAQLGDDRRIRRARIHPIAWLSALITYQAGHGARGAPMWSPVAAIVDALDAAFYASFAAVEATGKRTLLALDVSGSMACGALAGVPGVTPRVASAVMALVTAASERDPTFVAFTAGLTKLHISPRHRLDEVVKQVSELAMGGTDCALPMQWAESNRVDVDTFCIYTDNETWAANVNPAKALRAYRNARGIPAKLIVVGMTSKGFTLADSGDAGMLDVIGFDASTPPVIADFARAA
jgi:60 kDa SS-A/Ro ribonucleoprotein